MKKVFFLLCAFVFSAFAAGQEKTQSGTTGKTIVFEYDAAGNRIARKTKDNSAVISNKNATEETSDSRPAQEESREALCRGG